MVAKYRCGGCPVTEKLPAVRLQLDVGNTRLKWRLLRDDPGGDAPPSASILGRGFLVSANYASPVDALSDLEQQLQPLLGLRQLHSLRVASVAAPEVSVAISRWAQQQWGIAAEFACVSAEASGVTAGYDNPELLGVDRWLAVLAASRYGREGFIVVDAGSAVTVDLVCNGQHRGGYIVPGLRLMNRALFGDTARVKVQASWTTGLASVEPGRDTAAAVSGGLPLMVVGLVQEVLRRQQAAGDEQWRVLLCGGDAPFLATLLPAGVPFQVVDDLVLDGLPLAAVKPLDPADGV